eukprot:TRINITY_DN73571_c0_g1_i1.p1 TRINITY_DN73571_c0_g1~~TRINITY_DN73571_c0_g1_i1.p1  ORF type:complete len:215 (-),score=54.07 TRINITY_DN73571_c0_g1_i1:124-768(-)
MASGATGSTDDKKKLLELIRKNAITTGELNAQMWIVELGKANCKDDDFDYNERPYYRSALWEAATRNHENIVKMLADRGAQLAFADYQGRTPLHEAAYYGHLSLVQYLVDKGHPLDPLDTFEQTPLYRAVEAGRSETVLYLVNKKAETNRLDSFGSNLFHAASFNGMPDMAEWLLYKGSWKNRFAMEDGGAVVVEDHGEHAEAPAEGAAEKAEE